jgi:hypothetical protein
MGKLNSQVPETACVRAVRTAASGVAAAVDVKVQRVVGFIERDYTLSLALSRESTT